MPDDCASALPREAAAMCAPMQVSGASAAWLLHWVILKAVLYALGIPAAVPFLEVVAYAGYPFVPTCLAMVAAIPSTIPGHSAGVLPFPPMLGPTACHPRQVRASSAT